MVIEKFFWFLTHSSGVTVKNFLGKLLLVSLLGSAFSLLGSCKTSKSVVMEDEPLLANGKPKFCAAMRGNGHYIMTHFGSLARIVEHFGPLDGIAGGSSGSVSSFIYESMLKNPILRQCGSRACTREEASLRLSLMLKSVIGYFDVNSNSSEAMVVYGMRPLLVRAKALGIVGAIAETGELRDKLIHLLSASDVEEVVNKEIFDTLKVNDPVLAVRNAKEVYSAIADFGQFSTENQTIFMRPGIFDFKAVSRKFGRVGSFYAGYEPVDRAAFAEWLDTCAVAESRGEFWELVTKRKFGDSTCGEEFSRIVVDFRDKLIGHESEFPSRIKEQVGSVIPMLISTSIIYGESNVADVKIQQGNYLVNKPSEIKPGLSGIKFGYWGDARSLAALEANEQGYSDLRTKKRFSLGTATWEQVLSLSPAEPGLARIQIINEELASAGGWSDLSPTTVLKMLGCENTIYVTRRGDETPFADGIAKLLGIRDFEREKLYSLDNPKSSFSESLKNSSGIWCTDWNRFTDMQTAEMARHSYSAPLVTRSEFFTSNVLASYDGIVRETDFRGCSAAGTP